MLTTEALEFLSRHQPMPDEENLDEATINQYDEARKLFLAEPDERCIPLFLNSFGTGSGLGVYQLVEDVLVQFDNEQVLPHLLAALESPIESVRYWNAQVAASFPSPQLIGPLSNLLDDDYDTQAVAITALGEIENPEARKILEKRLESETDPELRELLSDGLE